jgi:predicted dehydrogenase
MDKLPVGVIGVGHLGSLHAKMFASIHTADLVGVSDLDAARAQAVAREFKTRAFTSTEELLGNVRAVSIATPTSTHFEIARKAAERGVHLFIEKPITQTVREAEELLGVIRTRGVTAQVGHIERFNPALLALEPYELRPMFVESHRLAQFNPRGTDVAVVLDLMIHDIDIILSLVRSPVKNIEASGVAVVSDTIDIANARLQFQNGCVANVTASRISQKKMRKMRLFQRDAYISVDFSEGTAEVFRLVDAREAASRRGVKILGQMNGRKGSMSILYEKPKIKQVNALKYELEMFVEAVNDAKQPVVTAEEAKSALETAHMIMEKIRHQELPFS